MRSAVAAAVVLQVVLGVASLNRAYAGCNLIPGTAKTFNATLGATNRPFAAPGERLEVTLRSCDPGTLVPSPTPGGHGCHQREVLCCVLRDRGHQGHTRDQRRFGYVPSKGSPAPHGLPPAVSRPKGFGKSFAIGPRWIPSP